MGRQSVDQASTIQTDSKSKVPTWLSSGLKSRRTWKTWIRCMVCLFAGLVLLVCQSSLETAGQAAFFSSILVVMLPPFLPFSAFFFAVVTIVVGMCLGWAWGVAGMAAALKARDRTLLASQYTRAQASISPSGASPDSQFQTFIFQGAFLDTRSTVVFGIFFFFGAYALGSVRALAPKLTLLSIFGTIVLDVMFSYGPLFPSAQYTLAVQFLIPTGFFVAIALASIILIFPQTLNHSVTDQYIEKVLKPGNGLLTLQERLLRTPPSDTQTWATLFTQATELRQAFSTGMAELIGSSGMLSLKISYGRVGAKDLKLLIEKSKILVGRLLGIGSFQLILQEAKRDRTMREDDEKQDYALTEDPRADRAFKIKDLMDGKERSGNRTVEHLLPILHDSSLRLRAACQNGLQHGIDWLEWTNTHRWRRGSAAFPSGETAQQGLDRRRTNLEELRSALHEFRQSDHLQLLEPFRSLFDAETGEFKNGVDNLSDTDSFQLSTRSLFDTFVFVTNLVAYATALIDFLQVLLEVEGRSPFNKIQWPLELNKAVKMATSRGGPSVNPLEIGTHDVDGEDDIDTDSETSSTSATADEKQTAKPSKGEKRRKTRERREKKYRLDPDAERPRNAFQRFLRTIGFAWAWQSSPEGLFALKYGLVSIALWIPSICPSSAYFVYTHRGLWALIMSQTGLGIFAGEQIAGFVARMGGTLVGLVLGMLAWYMGAGHGTGNPYGVVAATLFIVGPWMFCRLCAPQALSAPLIMVPVTVVFVVGYSWVDTHLPVLANSGWGVDLAWKRAQVLPSFALDPISHAPTSFSLLVLIGFTAAFLISLFPKPQSAKTTVRKTLAKAIDNIAELFTEEIKGFLLKARVSGNAVEQKDDIDATLAQYRMRFLGLVGKLQAVVPQIANAKFEPGLRGPWPRAKYETMMSRVQELMGALALLSNSWSRMEARWAKVLVDDTPFFEPNFIADALSVLSLCTHSLRDGQPMPASLPLLERLATHSVQKRHRTLDQYASREEQSDQIVREALMVVPRGVNGGNVAQSIRLNWTMLQDEQLAVYATATIALSHIVSKIDQIHAIVRSLVGEQRFDALTDLARERAERDTAWLDAA